jgi:hypothetical protein
MYAISPVMSKTATSSMTVVPMNYNGLYGTYVLIDNEKQDSVIAEDGSVEEVSEIDETEVIDLDDIDSNIPYVNLDNYKLNDPIIQFYFGSITVIGLFILFRLMSKPK